MTTRFTRMLVAVATLALGACAVVEPITVGANYPAPAATYPPQAYVTQDPNYVAPAYAPPVYAAPSYIAPAYPSTFYAPTIIVPPPIYIAPRPAVVAVAPAPRVLPSSVSAPHFQTPIVRPPSLLSGLPGHPHAGPIVRPPSITHPPVASHPPAIAHHAPSAGGFMHARPSQPITMAPPSHNSHGARQSGQKPSRWR